MPMVTWFEYDNFIEAEELARRIGAYVNLIDQGGVGGSWVWNPIYVWPDAENPTRFLTQSDPTLFVNGQPKTWTTAATFQNNPYHYMIDQGEPLLTAEDLSHLNTTQLSGFVEYYALEPGQTPPEEPPPEE